MSDLNLNTYILNWKVFSKTLLTNDDIELPLKSLDDALSHRSFLVGDSLTDADCEVFSSLKNNTIFTESLKRNSVSQNLSRYYYFLESLDQVKEYTIKNGKSKPIITKKDIKPEKSCSNVKFEEGGKFVGLKDAVEGEVVVRFPPEASGFLHIGHAKAALINHHYKDHYKGKLLLRFDDTNPAKESAEFEHVILEDVKKLGIEYQTLSYTSDHFDTLIQYCEKMIQQGQAYADFTDPQTMKIEREQMKDSKCRSQTIDENFKLWQEMKMGTEVGVTCCIRLKLDMSSKNGCMRDPTIYRCKAESHVRTGDKYKVYPTYDFACPIVDSIEGVTHSLRTSEYNDRNEQFYAILEMLSLRKPNIADYSRLSLQNTVLSKRKLTWIVDNGYVDGWEDPRMPTVRGILRHGMTVEGLKEFVIAQGFGRANVVMEWDKIWAFNKKVIDPIAPRYSALSAAANDLIEVCVQDQIKTTEGEVALHPKNADVGSKNIWYTHKVLVERSDVDDFVVGSNVTFVNWGNLRIESIKKDANNVTIGVDACLNLEDRDYKKTLKVTWLPVGHDNDITKYTIPITVLTYSDLISKNVLDKDDDFKNFINVDSRKEECLLGDFQMNILRKGDIIQIQRKGYFICDESYIKNAEKEYPLVLINIPEGNKKERVTTGLKQKSANQDSETINVKGDANSAKNLKQPKGSKVDGALPSISESEKIKIMSASNSKILKCVNDTPNESVAQIKKQTRLGLEASKIDNFSEWYTQAITKAEMIEYYNISGCYILLPHSIHIWNVIKDRFTIKIDSIGVKECYFPLFIAEESLNKEKDHIADFTPEVAWVTHSGDKKMEQRVAIRPTSETVMYPYYGKKIKSHRDLPLKLNQWCNVVRWEFKNPVPFIRTREFLWQEGHTAYANQDDAIKEVYEILDFYADIYENLLAIPVVKGRKTEKEKFAGGDFTTTTEIYIPANGRAIQGATSHHLGQNFSKMFDVKYQSASGETQFVYQNSWGMTTRMLGVMVMVHGDNMGLVLPPKVAMVQVVIIPCGITVKTSEKDKATLLAKCTEVRDCLLAANVRVEADLDDFYSSGWKFNHYELIGVPIRIEIGPRDLKEEKVMLCYRYNGVKESVSQVGIDALVLKKFDDIHAAMFAQAKDGLDSHRMVAYSMDELCKGLDNKMMITAPFCGDKVCEDEIKTISARDSVVEEGAPSMGAKSLCIPFDMANEGHKLGDKCINSACSRRPTCFTMFGRSY